MVRPMPRAQKMPKATGRHQVSDVGRLDVQASRGRAGAKRMAGGVDRATWASCDPRATPNPICGTSPTGSSTSDVTSHTFRRTVATLMDEAGLSARAAADQLGHAKVSMTQDHYF